MNNGLDYSIHKKADLAYENYLEEYKIAGKEVFFGY
jgi:hypothetical protein